MNNNLGDENENNSSTNQSSQMNLSSMYGTTFKQTSTNISSVDSKTNPTVQNNQPFSNPNETNNYHLNNVQNSVNDNIQTINQENNSMQNLNNSVSQANINNQNSFSKEDMELLKSFIGNNYEKIITKPFNFAGFFFNSFYMFYRKMFVYGLITYIILFALMVFVKNTVVNLVLNIMLGFVVNKIYLNFATKKISKIKQENPNKNLSELKSICASQGGVSIGNIFLGFLITLGIGIITVIISILLGITSFAGSFFGDLISGIKSSSTGQYNGVLMFDTNVKMQDEFSVTVPSEFENNSTDDSYDYEITESNNNGISTCSLNFALPDGYKSAENLITQLSNYNKEKNLAPVTSININNINWYTVSYEDDFGKTYYYATDKNNKVYLLTYELSGNPESTCLQYKDQIVNSIQSK